MVTEDVQPITDHDRLIRIDTRLKDLIDTVADIKDGTSVKIALLEKSKADRDVVENIQKKLNEDIEHRVSNLETTRQDFRSKLADNNRYMSTYSKWLLAGIGITFALLIWHVTSGVGGFHI